MKRLFEAIIRRLQRNEIDVVKNLWIAEKWALNTHTLCGRKGLHTCSMWTDGLEYTRVYTVCGRKGLNIHTLSYFVVLVNVIKGMWMEGSFLKIHIPSIWSCHSCCSKTVLKGFGAMSSNLILTWELQQKYYIHNVKHFRLILQQLRQLSTGCMYLYENNKNRTFRPHIP